MEIYLYYLLYYGDIFIFFAFQNDLVCLPIKLAQSLGGIHQMLLCNRVASLLQFVDPSTLQGD